VSDLVLEAKGAADSAGTQRLRAVTRLAADIYALALLPEVGPGVVSIEVAATRSDGRKEVLLFAKDIPLEWPTPYVFKEPVLLRAGTELSVVAHYAATERTVPAAIRLTVSRYSRTTR